MLNTSLCYIDNGTQYLMLHRVKKDHDVNHGKWIGIGGKMKEESPEECMIREVREESGLEVVSWQYRGVLTFLAPPGTVKSFICLPPRKPSAFFASAVRATCSGLIRKSCTV